MLDEDDTESLKVLWDKDCRMKLQISQEFET